MLKRLLSILRPERAPKSAAPSADIGPSNVAPAEPSPFASIVLVSKNDAANRFGIEGYECEAFVHSMRSTTGDQNIAAHFATTRTARNEAVAGAMPEGAVEHPCDLSYPCPDGVSDGPLRKAEVMEDKWDIYLYGDRLYFCRSWTNRLVFAAQFSWADTRLHLTRIWAQDAIEASMSVRQVDYLIKSHLERRRAPHPLPSSLARDPESIAMYSFGEYGRICCFGSFEDTLAIP
jgi:hypothetical protein